MIDPNPCRKCGTAEYLEYAWSNDLDGNGFVAIECLQCHAIGPNASITSGNDEAIAEAIRLWNKKVGGQQ